MRQSGEAVGRFVERTKRVTLCFAILLCFFLFSLIGYGECDDVGIEPRVYTGRVMVMAFRSIRDYLLD